MKIIYNHVPWFENKMWIVNEMFYGKSYMQVLGDLSHMMGFWGQD